MLLVELIQPFQIHGRNSLILSVSNELVLDLAPWGVIHLGLDRLLLFLLGLELSLLTLKLFLLRLLLDWVSSELAKIHTDKWIEAELSATAVIPVRELPPFDPLCALRVL
jgi:hypothetical protein